LRATLAGPLLFGLLVIGCGSTSPGPTAVPSATGVPASAATTSPIESPASTSGPASNVVPPASGPLGSAGAVVDPALLALIPAGAAGLDVTFDPETTSTEVADPTLDPNVAGLATGLGIRPGESTGTELVIVNVVRLRDPSVDDQWFRRWRDSYDTAACERAGGVTGHATTTVNGHAVFIGSCAGGAFTYHLRIAGGGVIVSLTSVGPSRLGERLVDAIPPG
jgi:hypothetical protein